MTNPNNCAACDHKKRPDGGWCYFFCDEPDRVCMKHTMRSGMTVNEVIDDLFSTQRRRELWQTATEPHSKTHND